MFAQHTVSGILPLVEEIKSKKKGRVKSVQKIIITICFLAITVCNVSAQTVVSSSLSPVAFLSVNGEKENNGNAPIDYSTSFFIKHISMDEKTKQQKINNVLTVNKSFTKLELKNITENKDVTDKGFMVVINLTATNNTDLTSKIKFLLKELNVNKVNYNNTEYTLTEFQF